MGGGRTLNLTGRGLSAETRVSVCGTPCDISLLDNGQSQQSETSILVVSPLYKDYATENKDITCNITIEERGETITFANAYSYKSSLTTKITGVNPSRSGTGGGM